MDENSIPKSWLTVLEDDLLNLNSIAICIVDADLNIEFANSAMLHFLGYNNAVQKYENEFINPKLEPYTKTEDDGLLFTGILTIGNSFNMSYTLNSKIYKQANQLMIYAEVDVMKLFEDNKKMSLLNQEVNNLQRQVIKDKKNLQSTLNELKKTQQMLIHSEKMNAMGQLVAGVAHEINNPISFVYSNLFSLNTISNTVINSYIELEEIIQNENNSVLNSKCQSIRKTNDLDYQIEDLSDLIDESKTGLERIKKIVEDLRTFSRLDESEIKRINLKDNFKSTIAIANTKLVEKSADFSFICPNELYADCYPGQLNQAILNVLVNANQAIEQNGFIKMQIENSDKNILITIQDNGCGISQDNLDKVFNPFFTTKPIGSGTGLGLSITHKIICETHKGTIKLESKPNEGTLIIISIPKNINS